MEQNTLVRHKKLKSAGIGCVAKVLSKKIKVNFGLNDVLTCTPSALEAIDTTNCKTIPFTQFRNRIISNKSTLNYAIVGNELNHFVGIGWIILRVITEEDLKKYPRVI